MRLRVFYIIIGIIVALFSIVGLGSPIDNEVRADPVLDTFSYNGTEYQVGDEIIDLRGRSHTVVYAGNDRLEHTFTTGRNYTNDNGQWVDYVFTEESNHYVVQHPYASVKFYDYYTEVWTEDFSQVIIWDDRWTVEYLNHQGRWTDSGLWQAERTYIETPNGIYLIRTGVTDIGIREEQYFFPNGGPCKVSITQFGNDDYTIRFVWKPSGIVAASETVNIADDLSTHPGMAAGVTYKDNQANDVYYFRWYDAFDLVSEGITVATDIHAQGRKADIYFAEFLISQQTSATLDPTTFYPDADPETTSVDGNVYDTGNNAPWATLIAEPGSGAADDGNSLVTYIGSAGSSPNWAHLYRTILVFDTSSLPDEGNIVDVRCRLYGTLKEDDLSITPDSNIFGANPASNTTLAAGDFDSVENTPFATAITYANWDAAGWNEFTFNNDGIDAVNQTGVSRFSWYNDYYDAQENVPVHPGFADASRMDAESADNGSNVPELVVYTETAPTVESLSSSNVEETTATLTGNITDTGGENAHLRGFQYDNEGGTPYSLNVTEAGSFGAGTYSLNLTSLFPGTTYYWRASANNSQGWGYGSELWFVTKPNPAENMTDTDQTCAQITLTWDKGAGSENTTVRYRTDAFPTGITDGTLGYSGTASTANITGLSGGQIYYFGAWAVNTVNQTVNADTSDNHSDYTLPCDPANLTADNTTCNSVGLSWTKGTGGDHSMLRYQAGSYPVDETSGTQGYYGTANYTTVTSLDPGTVFYWRVWARDTDSNLYSSGYSQTTATTNQTDAPTLTTSNATDIGATVARLNGQIDSIDCQNASSRGFEWGISSGNYTDNWTEAGSFGVGSYNHLQSGFSANTTYYYRAMAYNNGGWGYGNEINFTTLVTPPAPPGAPTDFTITQIGVSTANLTWTAGVNSTSTLIRGATTGYPSSPTGGYPSYNGSASNTTESGLTPSLVVYYYSAWGHNENGYSATYATASIGTESDPLSGLDLGIYITEDDMEVLVVPIETLTTYLTAYIPIAVFVGFALWKKHPLLYVIAGIATIVIGGLFTNTSFPQGMMIIAVGGFCAARGVFKTIGWSF